MLYLPCFRVQVYYLIYMYNYGVVIVTHIRYTFNRSPTMYINLTQPGLDWKTNVTWNPRFSTVTHRGIIRCLISVIEELVHSTLLRG